MPVTIEIQNPNQSYNVVKGLLDQREFAVDHGLDSEVEGIDDLLEQLEGTSVHDLIAKSDSDAFDATVEDLTDRIDDILERDEEAA